MSKATNFAENVGKVQGRCTEEYNIYNYNNIYFSENANPIRK